MTKIPSDEILESLYKLRIRESDQLKTVLEWYDMEIHQKISMPNHQTLKTMVKRSTDQKLRSRNSDARHGTTSGTLFDILQSILLPFFGEMLFLTAGPVVGIPTELPWRKNCGSLFKKHNRH